MDPISLILGAAVAGAADGIKKVASSAVQSGYATLKDKLTQFISPTALAQVETDPTNQAFKTELADELKTLTAVSEQQRAELQALAENLLGQIEQHHSDTDTSVSGVIIRGLKAKSLSIDSIVGGADGVQINDADVDGHVHIGDIAAGK